MFATTSGPRPDKTPALVRPGVKSHSRRTVWMGLPSSMGYMAKSAEQCRASRALDVTTSTGTGGRYLASRRVVLPPSENTTIMPGRMSCVRAGLQTGQGLQRGFRV
jgi:hypothetical protein